MDKENLMVIKLTMSRDGEVLTAQKILGAVSHDKCISVQLLFITDVSHAVSIVNTIGNHVYLDEFNANPKTPIPPAPMQQASMIPGGPMQQAPMQQAPMIPDAPKNLVDKEGVSWNGEVHTVNKALNKLGRWKRHRLASIKQYNQWAAEFTDAPAPDAPAPDAPAPDAPAPKAPAPDAPAPKAPAPKAPAPKASAPSLIMVIDEKLADLEDEGRIKNFEAWVKMTIDWVKPGAKAVVDLTEDIQAQQKLFDRLNTLG